MFDREKKKKKNMDENATNFSKKKCFWREKYCKKPLLIRALEHGGGAREERRTERRCSASRCCCCSQPWFFCRRCTRCTRASSTARRGTTPTRPPGASCARSTSCAVWAPARAPSR